MNSRFFFSICNDDEEHRFREMCLVFFLIISVINHHQSLYVHDTEAYLLPPIFVLEPQLNQQNRSSRGTLCREQLAEPARRSYLVGGRQDTGRKLPNSKLSLLHPSSGGECCCQRRLSWILRFGPGTVALTKEIIKGVRLEFHLMLI